MEVVRHQGIGVERERVALAHDPKPVDECLIITFADKYFLPIITTRSYVVEQSVGVDLADGAASFPATIDLGKSDTDASPLQS